jgi:TolB-like protein
LADDFGIEAFACAKDGLRLGVEVVFVDLADGIGEELVNELAKSDNLRVVARASTMSFKGEARNVTDIGAKLKVDSVLTGGVRRIGDRVRVSVQLVRASDSTQIWSDAFDYELKDVFAVQQQISKALASVLRVKLNGTAPANVSSEAYTLFLQGDFHLRKGNPANMTKAIDYFNAALRVDPNYARAYAGLARAYVGLARQGYPKPDVMAKAKDAAERALQLDNRLAEAHAALGYFKQTFGDWAAAEAGFRRAIECNPKNVEARFLYAGFLMNMERLSESWAQLKEAEELDPLSPTLPHFKAVVLLVERRYAESERDIRKALANSPEQPNAHLSLALSSFGQGKTP